VAVGEEELDAVGEEDALVHWEALFVVAACDAGDVAFPFVAEWVEGDFLGETLVVQVAAVGGWVVRKWVGEWVCGLSYYLLSSSMSMSFWAPVAGSRV